MSSRRSCSRLRVGLAAAAGLLLLPTAASADGSATSDAPSTKNHYSVPAPSASPATDAPIASPVRSVRVRELKTSLGNPRVATTSRIDRSPRVDTSDAIDTVALTAMSYAPLGGPATSRRRTTTATLLAVSRELRQLAEQKAPRGRGRITYSFSIDEDGQVVAPMVIGFNAALDAQLEAALASKSFSPQLAGMQVQNTLLISGAAAPARRARHAKR